MSDSATFKSLLKRFPAFRKLEPDYLEWLASKAKPFHADVGQDILLPDRIPEYCFCILEGRGRLLHEDPGLRRPVTLALSNPGDLVGWVGLARNAPCEWVTAATPMKLIGIDADDFETLLDDSPAFANWIANQSSPAEFVDALRPAMRRRSKAEPPEREILRLLLPGMKVVTQSVAELPPQDDAIWLWNSLPKLDNITDWNIQIGQPVKSDILNNLPEKTLIRLLRIDSNLWHQVIESDQEVIEPGIFIR